MTTVGKLTRNQAKVFNFLQSSTQNLSAQDIYNALRAQGSIGLATVYRALDTLKLAGLVRALTMPSGETVYSIIPSDRHHLNCLNCGKSLPIAGCPLQNLTPQIAQTSGFKIFYHTLEFFGLCPDCASTGEEMTNSQ
jgi:Fur family ferric uptake transcriptional regulator